MDRPARWDLNNSKSGLVHAHDSGLGRNLFNYHDRGARNVAVMPDVGVSSVDNDKCNPSMRLQPRPQRQKSNASRADANWLVQTHTCVLMNNSKRWMRIFTLPINTEINLQPNTAGCGDWNALVILFNPQVLLNLLSEPLRHTKVLPCLR